MQTIVTDFRVVCQSVCHAAELAMARAVCAGLLGAAFAKVLWPLVLFVILRDVTYLRFCDCFALQVFCLTYLLTFLLYVLALGSY